MGRYCPTVSLTHSLLLVGCLAAALEINLVKHGLWIPMLRHHLQIVSFIDKPGGSADEFFYLLNSSILNNLKGLLKASR